MKSILKLYSVIILLFSTSITYAQSMDYGLTGLVNVSSHTIFNPQMPQDGRFQWNSLTTNGFGFYIKKELSEKLELKSNFIYQSKGYKEIAQTGSSFQGGPQINNSELKNRLNYFSVANNLHYTFLNLNGVKIQGVLGVEQNFLFHINMESDLVFNQNEILPENMYSDDWATMNFNYQVGAAFNIQDKLTINPFFSRSLTPVLNLENHEVRDWIWGIKFDVSIYELFIKNNPKKTS